MSVGLLIASSLFLSSGANGQTLEEASRSYKQRKDYASLKLIFRQLRLGMPKTAAENLLGKADYSPIEGQDYYLSDKKEAAAAGVRLSIGMVVDYRDRQGRLTDSLQDFWLGEIGE
jgi:hypothetical protein